MSLLLDAGVAEAGVALGLPLCPAEIVFIALVNLKCSKLSLSLLKVLPFFVSSLMKEEERLTQDDILALFFRSLLSFPLFTDFMNGQCCLDVDLTNTW